MTRSLTGRLDMVKLEDNTIVIGGTTMIANVGSVDRLIRAVLGVVLILLPYMTTFGMWASPVARIGIPIIGLVLVVTALLRFCPLYRLIGCVPARQADLWQYVAEIRDVWLNPGR